VLFSSYLDDAGNCAWLGVMYMPPVTGTRLPVRRSKAYPPFLPGLRARGRTLWSLGSPLMSGTSLSVGKDWCLNQIKCCQNNVLPLTKAKCVFADGNSRRKSIQVIFYIKYLRVVCSFVLIGRGRQSCLTSSGCQPSGSGQS